MIENIVCNSPGKFLLVILALIPYFLKDHVQLYAWLQLTGLGRDRYAGPPPYGGRPRHTRP